MKESLGQRSNIICLHFVEKRGGGGGVREKGTRLIGADGDKHQHARNLANACKERKYIDYANSAERIPYESYPCVPSEKADQQRTTPASIILYPLFYDGMRKDYYYIMMAQPNFKLFCS